MNNQMKELKIQESKRVWVAWTNTDCTEGRGRRVPKAVCDSEATAIRLGKKGYVMGADCPITENVAVKIGGIWLAPCVINASTMEDDKAQDRINLKRELLEKIKAAGLSEDELKILMNGM